MRERQTYMRPEVLGAIFGHVEFGSRLRGRYQHRQSGHARSLLVCSSANLQENPTGLGILVYEYDCV